jgi:hypothetical protein
MITTAFINCKYLKLGDNVSGAIVCGWIMERKGYFTDLKLLKNKSFEQRNTKAEIQINLRDTVSGAAACPAEEGCFKINKR